MPLLPPFGQLDWQAADAVGVRRASSCHRAPAGWWSPQRSAFLAHPFECVPMRAAARNATGHVTRTPEGVEALVPTALLVYMRQVLLSSPHKMHASYTDLNAGMPQS